MKHKFLSQLDLYGVEFFTLNLNATRAINVSHVREVDPHQNIASLLLPFLFVTKRVTGPFHADLTETRDDFLLAFISLVLLLIIDSIATTLLIRTNSQGVIGNFSFSIKQIIELLRHFEIRTVFSTKQYRSLKGKRINFRLVIYAALILSVILVLEVSVLFLTDPISKKVMNTSATFRLLQPVLAEWPKVSFHTRVSINRPCESITFDNVEQRTTRINGCVQTDLNFSSVELLAPTTQNITLEIVSHLHDYGSDHLLNIGNLTANYSTRAFFTLGDSLSRVMKTVNTSRYEEEQIELTHVQFVAYMFTLYRKALAKKDQHMDLSRLEDLDFSFQTPTPIISDQIDVLQLPGNPFWVTPRTYKTTVSGVLPQGTPVLRLAQHFFRGLAAVIVTEGDDQDLFMDRGIARAVSEVWEEKIRLVNWLCLIVVVCVLLLFLLALRCFLKPVALPNIAGVYVKDMVGANLWRSPVEMSDNEDPYFKVRQKRIGSDYSVGAEVLDRRTTMETEYDYSSDSCG